MKPVFWLATHLATLVVGFAAGIYLLPILTAPPAPKTAELELAAKTQQFSGTFVRTLKDSDALHWGEGKVIIAKDSITLDGKISPGPDYKLYLSPIFVETEAEFKRLKSQMVRVGDVKTFNNFVVPLAADIDPKRYTTIVIWCETFSEFITAAKYQ